MEEISIVYMCAGISSRFGGKIKQFAKVGPNGETLIEYSLNQALKAGFSRIIFIVGNKTEKEFKEKFGNKYKNITIDYALQYYDEEKRDKPWGTTDALCSIKDLINGPFVVCNGDDIYGEESFKILFNHLKENEIGAAIGYKLKEAIPKKGKVTRGIMKIDEQNNLVSIKETFDIEMDKLNDLNLKEDDLCSMNIFALHPESLSLLNKILEKTKRENTRDRKKECLLPEDIGKLITEKKIKIKIYPATEEWTGITSPEDEELVRQKLKSTLSNN